MVKSLNGENYVYTCLLALYHWTEQVYDIGGTIERNRLAEIKARIMNAMLLYDHMAGRHLRHVIKPLEHLDNRVLIVDLLQEGMKYEQ